MSGLVDADHKSSFFQVLSDLHLEVAQQYADFHIEPCAPYLILAGDIGRLADHSAYREFLLRQCKQFKRVFLILGNHEFYGVTHVKGLALAQTFQQDDAFQGVLHVMYRTRLDLPHLTILGCTLFSDVPEDAKGIVNAKINDFRRIKGWTVDDHNSEHQRDLAWLKDETARFQEAPDNIQRKLLVITHYAPTRKGTSAPENENNPWSSAFSTDLLSLPKGQKPSMTENTLDRVHCWIFGHTHYCTDFVHGRTRLVSNQRGYVFPASNSADTARTTESDKLDGWFSKVRQTWKLRRARHTEFNPKYIINI